MHQTVRAVNDLTARWGRDAATTGRNTVFSAPGAWAPLAFLAAGAGGRAAAELAEALRVRPRQAAEAGRELLAALDGIRGVRTALGLWTRDGLPIEPGWAAALPPHSHRRFTGDRVEDQAAVDGWAAERTAGAIPRMPVTLDEGAVLLLASALTVHTDWIRRFRAWTAVPETGAWRGRRIAELHRTTALLDRVGVADTAAGPLTVLKVLGVQGVDVHLCLGTEDAAPGEVLAAAVRTAQQPRLLRAGSELGDGEPGPGLRAGWIRSYDRDHRLDVSTVEFDLTDRHSLLERAELFGLATATDLKAGHFPGISSTPLAVGSAAQTTTAVFGPRGFRAASVTALGLAVGGAALPPPYAVRRIEARFDRPFAFLAVHRTSRLALAAGWVAGPKEAADTEYDEYDEDDAFDDEDE